MGTVSQQARWLPWNWQVPRETQSTKTDSCRNGTWDQIHKGDSVRNQHPQRKARGLPCEFYQIFKRKIKMYALLQKKKNWWGGNTPVKLTIKAALHWNQTKDMSRKLQTNISREYKSKILNKSCKVNPATYQKIIYHNHVRYIPGMSGLDSTFENQFHAIHHINKADGQKIHDHIKKINGQKWSYQQMKKSMWQNRTPFHDKNSTNWK